MTEWLIGTITAVDIGLSSCRTKHEPASDSCIRSCFLLRSPRVLAAPKRSRSAADDSEVQLPCHLLKLLYGPRVYSQTPLLYRETPTWEFPDWLHICQKLKSLAASATKLQSAMSQLMTSFLALVLATQN